jgi:hypothetical protein
MHAVRNAVLLATALCGLTACAPKGPDTAADAATLKAEAPVWFKLYNAGDAAGVAGDLAWVTGTYVVANASGATVDKGKYVTIYRRANGKWPIIRDTWNSSMPPAAAPAPASRT